MQTAISVQGLGKKYILRHVGQGRRYVALRDVLAQKIDSFFRRRPAESATREEFWALKDVSFEIKQGEAVGIIGRNGAGKSTLLKLLSRITRPTRGRIEINGRVASLLEVGTGFHPELTGRENIYLNGAIMGMARGEIRRKFDEIVAFAEVEKFLDTPVKRYSSGMYMRLAFAVAAHLEPDILIVDEVLAVGDAQFQKKCLGKMSEISGRDGRTVLFVSHNMSAISALTQKLIVLKQGVVEFAGPVQEGINLYLTTSGPRGAIYQGIYSKTTPTITKAEIKCSEAGQTHNSGEEWRITFHLHHPHSITKACLSFEIVNQSQQPVLHLCAYDQMMPACTGDGTLVLECVIPELKLNVGSYYIKAYFSEPPGGATFEVIDGVCPFDVIVLNRTTLFGWRPEVATYLESGIWSIGQT